MISQVVYVNGKQRKSVVIRGREYLRKGYDLPIDIAERFSKKCDLLGEDESKIVEKLITAFTEVNGWGEETKQPPIFEYRSGPHIKDAAQKAIKGLFPWIISRN